MGNCKTPFYYITWEHSCKNTWHLVSARQQDTYLANKIPNTWPKSFTCYTYKGCFRTLCSNFGILFLGSIIEIYILNRYVLKWIVYRPSICVLPMKINISIMKMSYHRQIQQASISYYCLRDEKMSKGCSHPFRNGGHKTTFYSTLL